MLCFNLKINVDEKTRAEFSNKVLAMTLFRLLVTFWANSRMRLGTEDIILNGVLLFNIFWTYMYLFSFGSILFAYYFSHISMWTMNEGRQIMLIVCYGDWLIFYDEIGQPKIAPKKNISCSIKRIRFTDNLVNLTIFD